MKIKFGILLAFSIYFSICLSALDETKVINELKVSQYGSIFFKNHSEREFILIMKFLESPVCCFSKIKRIANLFAYIEVFDRYSAEKGIANECILYPFLERHFNKIDREKADILNHLLLIADGMYGEILADKYSKLFKNYAGIFIKTLKKTNWKEVVDRLDAGDWKEFRQGITKLGDSEFEINFKNYVFAPRDEKGNRIQN
jgi:hypothetical protein